MLQLILDRRNHAFEWPIDQVLEFGSGETDLGRRTGKVNGQRRRCLGRQPFLGLLTLVAQSGQRTDSRGGRGVGVGGSGEPGEHRRQHRQVDLVAGEVRVTHGVRDRLIISGGIYNRDTRATAAEIEQHDQSVARQTRFALQRDQRRYRIGDKTGRHPGGGQFAVAGQGVGKRTHRSGTPVRGHRHFRRNADGIGHCAQCLDHQAVSKICGPVRSYQWHRVADSLHEAPHHQP